MAGPVLISMFRLQDALAVLTAARLYIVDRALVRAGTLARRLLESERGFVHQHGRGVRNDRARGADRAGGAPGEVPRGSG
jgi:hypothetical protein